MSAPAWMPLYVADYLADTLHLNATQSGAYLHLIMHYWQHGGLPDDDEQLACISRIANASDWQRVRTVIAPLFRPGWRHKRVDAELTKARDMMEKRTNAGKIGAYVRHSKRIANAQQTQVPSPPPYKKEDTSLRSVSKKEAPPKKRASRIPENFVPDLDEAERLGLSHQAAEQEAASFTDYWRSKPVNATKLDWSATWRNWVRKSLKDHNKGDTHGQRQPLAHESPTRRALRSIGRG